MDSKQGALYIILVLGGIGLLAVSCSDSDDTDSHSAMVGHVKSVESADHKAVDMHASPMTKTEAHAPTSKHEPAKTHVAAAHVPGHEVHWGYQGEGAPFLWGDLKAEFELCGTGKRQSPIDISSVTITELSDIEFNYKDSPLEIANNGHTIQVNYLSESYITVAGKRYDLLQFHFHAPSEHTVGGKRYDMVAHLVHKAADGQLGVIGVMFEEGDKMNNDISKLWLNMPEKAGVTTAVSDVIINAADLLPKDFTYFNYSGSLTTPPCSEGVNWMVLATPNTIAKEQVKQFTKLFPSSTRPVQPLNGRVVNVSN